MVFSSAVFLFVFLPAVWLLHTVIPARFLRARNVLLCVASLLFYAYGEPIYILLMLGSVLVNYVLAIRIGGARERGNAGRRKALTVCAVILNLGILGFFKYVPWLVSLANAQTKRLSLFAVPRNKNAHLIVAPENAGINGFV